MTEALTPNPDHCPDPYHRIPSAAMHDDFQRWLGQRVIAIDSKLDQACERAAKHSAQIAHHAEHIGELTGKVDVLEKATSGMPIIKASLATIAVSAAAGLLLLLVKVAVQ